MDNGKIKLFQKALRTNQTDAENTLWYHIRNRQLNGLKFRRQHILNGYVVDFVCLESKVIIELDGGQHSSRVGYDKKRTMIFERDGFRVLRFWNNEISSNLEGVLDIISNASNLLHCGNLSLCGRENFNIGVNLN